MSILSPRSFAIIPAAGVSARMGEPKLLLPWRGSSIVDHVLRAWTDSMITCVTVVIRSSDTALYSACQRWQVAIVRPEFDPRDMKESIQCGLRHVESLHHPRANDRWLVAPADLPRLSAAVIDAVIAASTSEESIVVARFGSRRGHPVSFPWSLVPEVFKLGVSQGIDRIMASHPTVFIDLPVELAIDDMDSPDDYRRLSNQ